MAKESLIISGHDIANALFFSVDPYLKDGIYLCPRCGRFITSRIVEIGFDDLYDPGVTDGCDRFLQQQGPDSYEKWLQYSLREWGDPVNSIAVFTITPLF